MPPTQTDYLTVVEVADNLGVAAGDVLRLIDDGRIETVELIRADSLRKFKEAS